MIQRRQHLHDLGTNKWRHMREYIRLLRRHDLGRDPPARRGSSRGGRRAVAEAQVGGRAT